MKPRDVLDLPIEMFWLLHKNIDRMAAERDYRTATILAQVHTPEGVRELLTGLRKQIGTVVEYDEGQLAMQEAAYDRDGLLALKGLGKL
ncbi:hypothetical protein SAMN05216548_1143 [Faunimonas pinastri]|uniref:Uncharacterized protein n=1 Tax=Faunimonas pinastri TaxID=1855383 RepID=A0A1H9MQ40_9HYPH|nr:hypothetical protein [Faunimonas pinastri]SER25806.1 hypothetical protein SAMN05216548_1143 [Faunimonas pinastri]